MFLQVASATNIVWNCYCRSAQGVHQENRLLFSIRLTNEALAVDGKTGFKAEVIGALWPFHSGEYIWQKTTDKKISLPAMDNLELVIQECTKDFLKMATPDFGTTYYFLAQKAKRLF